MKEQVARVFELQRAHAPELAQRDAAARVARLVALREAIVARRDALAEAVQQDFRKSAAEFELTELHPVFEEIDHVTRSLARWMKPRRVSTPLLLAGTRSSVRPEPRGVVLILSPWNYPFNLLVMPLIAAVAAGNAVVLKPSNKTSHLARQLAELVKAVFPEEEVALFEGDHEMADALLELPFDHIFFTGSTQVGRKVMTAAARHLASVTLELGGKSPVFLDESADVESAAPLILWGKCMNAGQTCIAPDYVLAHEAVVEAFVERARAAVERFYGATPEERRASPDFARLIDDAAFRRVSGLLARSVEGGARVAVGGATDRATRYIEPTVLTGVTPAMPIMEEEIFGPVLPILTVKNMAEAVAFVRGRDKPLAAYIFAKDDVAQSIVRQTTAGGTVIGNVLLHVANNHLPFGGVGASGQGSYHGEHGFRTFSHLRAVVEQRAPSAARLFFPPYRGERRNRIAQSFLRFLQ